MSETYPISSFATKATVDGSEFVPVVFGGVNYKILTQGIADYAIAASTAAVQPFINGLNARYQVQPTQPTTRPFGLPLVVGDQWVNSTPGAGAPVYVWNGTNYYLPNIGASDIANQSDPSKGAALVGFDGGTARQALLRLRGTSTGSVAAIDRSYRNTFQPRPANELYYPLFSLSTAAVTLTIASPAVVTQVGHGLPAGAQVVFSTTGALPTGLTAGTTYFVLAPTPNTYNLSATIGGAAINTSGTQSGVHTASFVPGLATSAGAFAIGAGGGLVSATNGVNASGTIQLPAAIDPTKPFTAVALFEVNEDVNSLQFQLCNAAKSFWSGHRITSIKQSNISGLVGNIPTFSTIGGTVATMTIAAPALITQNGHGLPAGAQIVFSTTGALPTGLTAGVPYFVLNPTATTYNVAATSGGAAIATSGTQSGVHTVTPGAGATVDTATNIPAGTRFWSSVIGAGQPPGVNTPGAVAVALTPDIPKALTCTTFLKRTPGVQEAYNKINYRTDTIANTSSGAGLITWGQNGTTNLITQLAIDNASATSKLVGIYVCIGEVSGPPDYRMGAPGVMVTNTSQEPVATNEQTTLLPKTYGGPADTTLVLHCHPNGNPGMLGQSNSMPVVSQLFYGNYAQATMTGSQNLADFAGGTSSHWGAPTGTVLRRNLIDNHRKIAPYLGRLMAFSMSMGAQTALSYLREYGEIAAIAGVSPALDLTSAYNSLGFASIINAGYGTWYRCIQAGTGQDPATATAYWTPINVAPQAVNWRYMLAPQNWRNAYAGGTAYAVNDVVYKPWTGGIAALAAYDPVLTPGTFTAVPQKYWHGTSDLVIPEAGTIAYQTNVNAAGGSVQRVSVPGEGHLTAGMFFPADIQAFFDLYRDV